MADRTALITGASAGLGSEFARQFAASGVNLVLVARREKPMRALAEQLTEAHGIDVDILPADLSDPVAPAALFDAVSARGLEIDYLVNNAGSEGPDLIREEDWQACRDYLELMTMSVIAMCHYFIPPMQKRGFGRVLNVASVAGLITVSGDYGYGPTKAYIVALSRGLSSSCVRGWPRWKEAETSTLQGGCTGSWSRCCVRRSAGRLCRRSASSSELSVAAIPRLCSRSRYTEARSGRTAGASG